MKLMYGSTPVKSLNINYFERDTNDCTMIPSDLQAGRTAVARGQKITGTGKSFEFATYGNYTTNTYIPIPTTVNVVTVSSLQYPLQVLIALADMELIDFTTNQTIGNVVIDGTTYPLVLSANNGLFKIACDKTINLEVFYGKDNYS